MATAQASVVKVQISFRAGTEVRVAQDCLKELGTKGYSLVSRGTFTGSVPSNEFKAWMRRIGAQPEVDTIRILRES